MDNAKGKKLDNPIHYFKMAYALDSRISGYPQPGFDCTTNDILESALHMFYFM